MKKVFYMEHVIAELNYLKVLFMQASENFLLSQYFQPILKIRRSQVWRKTKIYDLTYFDRAADNVQTEDNPQCRRCQD